MAGEQTANAGGATSPARHKLNIYLAPDVAERLRHVRARNHVSQNKVVNAALRSRLLTPDGPRGKAELEELLTARGSGERTVVGGKHRLSAYLHAEVVEALRLAYAVTGIPQSSIVDAVVRDWLADGTELEQMTRARARTAPQEPRPLPSRPSGQIGEFLRGKRRERELSLVQVAEEAKLRSERITPSYLSRVERGAVVPGLAKCAVLADIYNVPLQVCVEYLSLDAPMTSQDTVDEDDPATLYELGKELNEAGKHDAAIARMTQGLERLGPEGDPADETPEVQQIRGKLLFGMASAYFRKDKQHLAESYVRRSLALKHLESSVRAADLGLLAAIFSKRLETYMARVVLREQIEVTRMDPSLRIFYVQGLHLLSMSHIDGSEYDEALPLIREAVEIGSQLEGAVRRGEEAILRSALADVLHYLGRGEESEAEYEKALELSAHSPRPYSRCIVRTNIAEALIEAGRTSRAKAILRDVAETARREELPGVLFLAIHGRRKAELVEGDDRAAERSFDHLVELRPQVQARRGDVFREFDAECRARGIVLEMPSEEPAEPEAELGSGTAG